MGRIWRSGGRKTKINSCKKDFQEKVDEIKADLKQKHEMDNRYIKVCATCANWYKGTCSAYVLPTTTISIYYCGKWYYAREKAFYLGYNIEPGTIPEEYKNRIADA